MAQESWTITRRHRGGDYHQVRQQVQRPEKLTSPGFDNILDDLMHILFRAVWSIRTEIAGSGAIFQECE